MAGPAFVGAGAGAVAQVAGTPATVSKTGCTVGNIIIAHWIEDGPGGSSAASSFSGLETLAGAAGMESLAVEFTSTMGMRLYIGRATATTVSLNVDTGSSGDDVYARIYEFSGVNTGTTLASVREGYTASGNTSTTITDASVTTTGNDRLAVQFVGVNDDNAVGNFTGETGGDWVEAIAEFASALGTDGCLQLQTATIAAAGTIDGGSYVMSFSDSWIDSGFALIPAAAVEIIPALVTARRI